MVNIIHLPICQSTNTEVAVCSDETLIWTTHQTHGRGQRGNSWEGEPDKNLAMSYLTRSLNLEVRQSFFLNMAASLAVAQVIGEFVQEVRVKWPNDVWVKNKKIAGILIETSLSGQNLSDAIIGIGININEVSQKPDRTSLKKETGKNFDIERIMSQTLEFLLYRIEQLQMKDFARLKSDYYSQLYLYQENAKYRTDSGEVFEGMILGVTQEGQLAISDGHKVRNFSIKQVSFLAS